MSHVFHRHLRVTPPTAVSGRGMFIRDADGREYLDACGGAAVSCLGHGHPEVRAAIHAQVDKLAYAHTSFFTTEPAEALADQLIRTAPAVSPKGRSEGESAPKRVRAEGSPFGRAYIVSGGSEAVEASLKMARQYFVEIGQPQRALFVARRQSYHGNTLGALAVGGNEWRRRQFGPLLIDVEHVSPCYPYREQQPGETAQAYGQRLADELDTTFRRLGPDKVIAFVAETVGGATAGVLVPVPGYFKAVREVCDRHGVLLILDEVMAGMGRCGSLHACEQEGIVPDLITIAKGLGGGFQPIGAVLVQQRIVEAMSAGSGFFQHGHTYLGHPVACAAALAVQQVIERDGLLAQVRRRGATLETMLRERFGNHPHVGDIRGRGLFFGIELVADRTTKVPFDPARQLHACVKREGMARGLMTYPMGGTIDGRQGDHVLLAPPFIVAEEHLAEIVRRLHEAVDAAIATV